MEMNTRARITAIIIALTLLTASCGTASDTADTTGTSAAADTTEAVTEAVGYDYSGIDLEGRTFSILNCEKVKWNMICALSYDEMNGEALNDAIYMRNQYVTDKMNFKLNEVNIDYEQLKDTLANCVLSGDDTYDIAYQLANQTQTGISDGYYYCLNDLDNLHLDESYWNQKFLAATSIAGKNYFAVSSLHLMSFDGLWCMYFNKDMMDDLKLEYPYQLVRDGEWTIDKLEEYCKAAANLNGDDSFTLRANGKAVYGMTSFYSCIPKFIFGFDAQYVGKDENDLPYFTADSEHFINAVQRLEQFLTTDGYYAAGADNDADSTFFMSLFRDGRALFLGSEIVSSSSLRDMETPFGLVPFPKLDENQNGYRNMPLHKVCTATIPTTSKTPEDAALVLDALSYESDASVLDVYFGVTVEQKGLRDEESIEMLNIIKDAYSFDISSAYLWCEKIDSTFQFNLVKGNVNVAGTIESYKSQSEEKIKATIGKMTK